MVKDQGLSSAIQKVYEACSFNLIELEVVKENNEYNACNFSLNEKRIIYRKSKITPTKIGQFVSVWRRNKFGVTIPHHINDNFDFMIINCESGSLTGQFVFPKQILLENHIISSDFKEGKRGFRVYPSWDIAINSQSIKTQLWQSKYFVNLSNPSKFELAKLQQLLKTES